MDLNSLVIYLATHEEEFEDCYKTNRTSFMRVTNSLFLSLPNCNVSSLDVSRFNTYAKVIKSFFNKKEYLEQWDYVKNTFSFLLLNVISIKYDEQAEFALEVLDLFMDLLKGIHPIHFNKCLNKERILEAMKQVIGDDVRINNAILLILEMILKFQGDSPPNMNLFVEKMFDTFQYQENVKSICILGKIILDRLTEMNGNVAHKMIRWILKESILFINQDMELSTKKEIFTLILNLKSVKTELVEKYYKNFSTDYKLMWISLMEISDELWFLCLESVAISSIAQEIFSITLFQFLVREQMVYTNAHSFHREMNEFFKTATQEQYILEKHFFFVCHMQELYSRLIWMPKLVLHCMIELFYNNQYKLDIPLLKSFFYLYPRLAISFSKPHYIALGNDFLRTMIIYSKHPGIYSFHREQLAWILKMGSKNLKIEVVRHWITKPTVQRSLISTIIRCRAGRVLLDLVMEDFDEETGRIAASLLQKLKNEHISREITEMLPVTCKQPKIFNCLILSKPGIPKEDEKKMLLIALMGVMIPSLHDNSVLRAACMYSNDLVENLRKEPKCLERFTTCISTLISLFNALERTQEDTAKEILYLLKNLISIQVKYQYQMKNSVDLDLTTLLNFSPRQTNRYLSTTLIILSAKLDPLIKLKSKSNLTLWYLFLELSENPETQENAIKCLQFMMTKYQWLAFTSSISSFIGIWCYQQADRRKVRIFMNFVISWLKILLRLPKFLRPYIPYDEIMSLVMRNGDVFRINYFSKMLKLI